jgi:flavin-dependent dehydrogenase
MNTQNLTAVIIGAGLGGLSLALQLKRQAPHVKVVLLERRSLPYPIATHKVGESTVEIAAHYFSETLGLRDHLQNSQLRKLGIRLFFSSASNEKIEKRVEMGSNSHFAVPTYQIDRGIFENHLVDLVTRAGIEILTESKVTSVSLGVADQPHSVTYERETGEHSLSCEWVIDASGRAGFLKRKLSLQRPSEHDSGAVWFRIKGRVDIDDWCDHSSWKEEHEGIYSRWYSTNHLTGNGYWVWLIPLSSGYTSIGVVFDPKIHASSNFRNFANTLDWMRKHEPQCAEKLSEAAHEVADYLAIKHYAHKCSRMISGDRWAITGDAGVFIDPLYSPGSDFIAIQNTFIVDAIARDSRSERFVGRCEAFNDIYQEITEGFLKTFYNQYPIFGNPRVMSLKVIWDYTIYWGFLAFIVNHGRLTDLETLATVKTTASQVYQLGESMQLLLRQQHPSVDQPVTPGFLDIKNIDFLRELNTTLATPHSPESFPAILERNLEIILQTFETLKAILEAPTPTWNSVPELLTILTQNSRNSLKAA